MARRISLFRRNRISSSTLVMEKRHLARTRTHTHTHTHTERGTSVTGNRGHAALRVRQTRGWVCKVQTPGASRYVKPVQSRYSFVTRFRSAGLSSFDAIWAKHKRQHRQRARTDVSWGAEIHVSEEPLTHACTARGICFYAMYLACMCTHVHTSARTHACVSIYSICRNYPFHSLSYSPRMIVDTFFSISRDERQRRSNGILQRATEEKEKSIGRGHDFRALGDSKQSRVTLAVRCESRNRDDDTRFKSFNVPDDDNCTGDEPRSSRSAEDEAGRHGRSSD